MAKRRWSATSVAAEWIYVVRGSRRAEACAPAALAAIVAAVMATLLVLDVPPARAATREVRFPIRLDDRFLTYELERSAFTEPDGTARVFDEGDGCNSLVLSDPEVVAEAGALRVRSAGEARFGVSLAGFCLLPLSWRGRIELLEMPHLDPSRPIVTFSVLDSKLLDDGGSEPLFSGTLWRWIKDYVHPRLEARIDLQGPVDELRRVLPAFGVGAPGSALDQALATLALDGVILTPGTVEVGVRMDVPEPPPPTPTPEPTATPEPTLSPQPMDSPRASPDASPPVESAPAASPLGAGAPVASPPAPTPPAASPLTDASPLATPDLAAPLTADELRQWEIALRQWDAFLTFVVKISGGDTEIAGLRRALLAILLEERYALIEALASPDASVNDPVRPLFLRTWARLAPVLRQVAEALPAEQALRYLSFVSAGDALQALDQLGPESGIEISAEGLRRLARLVAPDATEDPLAYGLEVDPVLRDLFGFGAPIPPPADNPEVEGDEPTSWLWFGATAWAAEPPEPDEELVKRLNAWAPTRTDITEYAPLAYRLLESVTEWLLARHDIDPAHVPVFRALVPATAWKESCWRQYVRRNDKLVPLTSSVGSVGIMQVNVAVWRGFYEVNGLRRDIAYNARAGGEILSRYFTDYAVARRENVKGGSIDALARAAYAAYNGGPAQLTRYRGKNRPRRERLVDDDFLVKYQKMKANDPLAVVDCYVD